jgi:hypothetical protein
MDVWIKCPHCGLTQTKEGHSCKKCGKEFHQPLTTQSQTPIYSSTKLGFENPQNNYILQLGSPWFWTLLFGCFYFAKHRVWSHFFLSFFLVGPTAGFSWLIYPFFAKRIIRKAYLLRGWVEIN